MDLFEKLLQNRGPIGQYSKIAHGYFSFPKLEGEISNRMIFRGKERIIWSLNNYLGMANHPEIRKTDTEAAARWGLAYPMGARMMSGNSDLHEELENELAGFVDKKEAILFNYGYQGIMSAIDCLVDRRDIIVYDAESHACIIDGLRMHLGKRFVYAHNDIESCEKQLQRATELGNETGGAILVITEGVFGMGGDQGQLKAMVDDAHGFGTMGKTGAGTGEEQGVQDEIDLYFSTFAKSMASIGAFMAGDEQVIEYIRYNSRSQIFAKALPMPFVEGNLKRLELLRTNPALKAKLWENVNALQNGLRERGFDIGNANTPVTPVYFKGSPSEAANMIMDIRETYNIFLSIVVYPVVPKGVMLLRLTPTAVHTQQDIEETLDCFSEVAEKLKAGTYMSQKLVGV
jgi:glycine C-acetyltransferase